MAAAVDTSQDEIDKLFEELARERGSEVNQLLRQHRNPQPSNIPGPLPQGLRPSDTLRLFDVRTMERWAKVPKDRLKAVQADNAVQTAWLLADAMQCTALADRKRRTAQNVLLDHEQEGCFENLLELEAFQMPVTNEQFLLCTTLVRRLDVEHILTGNYVFWLVDGGTRAYVGETIAMRAPADHSVRKIAVEGYAILRERAVFVNFFFEHLAWHTQLALPIKEYK